MAAEQPISVLHISSESSWRGGEQQIIYLVEESRKLGVDAIVACKAGSEVEKYCQANGLPHESLRFSSAYDVLTAFRIKAICKKLKIDLIQTHTSKSHTMAVISGLLGLSVPQIMTRRVDFPVKDNWFSRFKYNYSKIVRIICISDTILRITETDISDKSKLVSIHSGIDMNRFKEFKESDWLRESYQKDKSMHIIGNTSAISDQKDYYTFVNVAERILKVRQDIHFFIVGDGPDRKNIEGYVKSKGLTNKITLTGFKKNIREILPSFDIFLFTSKTEGLGTSVLDAMAAGVPIVTTNAGGVSEMIQHEINGLMYPVKDEEGLTEGVLKFMNDHALANTLSSKASETVRDFSKEKTASRTLALYKEVLKEKAIR
jgi:glycosyltransferase involved in cell wall biosynthesis